MCKQELSVCLHPQIVSMSQRVAYEAMCTYNGDGRGSVVVASPMKRVFALVVSGSHLTITSAAAQAR